MHEVILCNNAMPELCGCDFLAASESFYHADRTADFNVLIFVTEGAIYVTEDGTDFEIGAGELLILKKGVHHWGTREIKRGTTWYYLHFTLEENAALPQFSPDPSPISEYCSIGCSVTLPKKLSGLLGGSFHRSLDAFTRYFRSDDPMKRWQLNLRLFTLLGSLAPDESRAVPTLSDKICAYLSERVSKPFSAEELSREFYLSYKRLAAVFRAEKGQTMQQYHTALKMSEACRLLRSTLLPVGEIAAQLGFQDMLYFSRRFRQSTGCSPTEYRRLPKF